MENQVIFRDYQEQQASDHNNIQTHVRASADHFANDVVTKSNRYAGFEVTKSAQAEVKVSPGRLYERGGAIYSRAATVTQGMVPYLASAAQRIITVSVYGQEVETDIQERDFLVDTETGRTQPDAVPMLRSRSAELVFTQGAESADPQPPPIPTTHAIIAYILVDNLSVVSVTMAAEFAVVSTESLHARTNALEAFRDQIEPRVTSIASDLAALTNQVSGSTSQADFLRLAAELVALKKRMDVPELALATHFDDFSTIDHSDTTNTAALGYDANVDSGLRFPLANMSIKSMNIFSANDPNASFVSGTLLPRYASVLKLSTGAYHSEIGIAQYGFQTTEIVQKTVSKTRLRYGPYWYWYYPYYLKNMGGFRFVVWSWVRGYWYETYEETYTTEEVVNHSIAGAMVGQTFLNANDTWATRLGFYVRKKAANENISVALCEVTNGQPDMSRAILVQSYPHASIVTGWNVMNIAPTFLQGGHRYALVFISNANHTFGMAQGQSYIDGTFFYSTDGEYFLGDLTKDLMIQVYGAKFNSAQVAIELEALNLDGGINSIDLETAMVQPGSTKLIFEFQPNGSGTWFPLNETNVTGLNGVPPLCRFRARFVGTRDMQTGFNITNSKVTLRRPKTTLKHVSKVITYPSSKELRVKCTVEGFQTTPHDLNCQVRIGSTTFDADIEEVVLKDADARRYEITYRFNLAANSTSCRIIFTGTTTAASNIFHANERIFWAQ